MLTNYTGPSAIESSAPRDRMPAGFRELHLKFVRLFNHTLTRVGLTLPKYALLSQLVAFGPMTMTEMSRRLRISKPAVTHLVRRLEKARLLKRIPHPKDRRACLLDVLARGRGTVARAQKSLFRFIAQSVGLLDGREQEAVEKYLRQLSNLVDEALAHPAGQRGAA